MPEVEGSLWRRGALWVAHVLVWVLLSLVAIWVILQLRIVVMRLAVLAGVGPFGLESVDRFGTAGLGLLWVIGVGVMEGYLRAGMSAGSWRARFGRVLLIEGGLLGLCYGLQWLWA
jgi:hypothetical protein